MWTLMWVSGFEGILRTAPVRQLMTDYLEKRGADHSHDVCNMQVFSVVWGEKMLISH